MSTANLNDLFKNQNRGTTRENIHISVLPNYGCYYCIYIYIIWVVEITR